MDDGKRQGVARCIVQVRARLAKKKNFQATPACARRDGVAGCELRYGIAL